MRGWDRTRRPDLGAVNRRQAWRRWMRRLRVWWRGIGAVRLPAWGDMQ